MIRVLVTGASGNVGREVVEQCRARGMLVRVAQRGATAVEGGLTQTVPFDFLDQRTWDEALTGCDRVFLVRPPVLADMAATLNPFVSRAYKLGIKHIVFLSVVGAERMDWVPHRKVEKHLASEGGGYTLLRAGFFAQNLQDAYRRDIVEEHRLYVPAGEGRVTFVDVRDVAAVAALVFTAPGEHQGKAYALTGPEALGFEQVAGILSQELGVTIRYQAASLAGYALHLRSRRRLARVQVLVQCYLHFRLRFGDAADVDPTLQQLLGHPAGTLAQYVRRSANVWAAARVLDSTTSNAAPTP